MTAATIYIVKFEWSLMTITLFKNINKLYKHPLQLLHFTYIKSHYQVFILILLFFSVSCKNDTSKHIKEAI